MGGVVIVPVDPFDTRPPRRRSAMDGTAGNIADASKPIVVLPVVVTHEETCTTGAMLFVLRSSIKSSEQVVSDPVLISLTESDPVLAAEAQYIDPIPDVAPLHWLLVALDDGTI